MERCPALVSHGSTNGQQLTDRPQRQLRVSEHWWGNITQWRGVVGPFGVAAIYSYINRHVLHSRHSLQCWIINVKLSWTMLSFKSEGIYASTSLSCTYWTWEEPSCRSNWLSCDSKRGKLHQPDIEGKWWVHPVNLLREENAHCMESWLQHNRQGRHGSLWGHHSRIWRWSPEDSKRCSRLESSG